MSTPNDIPSEVAPASITIDQAYSMGAKGAEPTEEERKLFEAWMAGHCWEVEGGWDGRTYVHSTEINLRQVHFGAMRTRQLWAAWRDRAALAAPAQKPSFKVGNLVTLTQSDYPGLGQWFVQLWDADEIVARVYGDDKEMLNRRIAALTALPAAQPEWVPVTQELLNAQHPWLYKDMWIAMKDGGVMTGHYKWMQGRYPDRFVIGSSTHVWAFEATHVMPMNQPKHPNKESS